MASETEYDFSGQRARYTLREYFNQRPALNAVIGLPGSDSTSPTAAALAAYTIANKNFEVLGTNMTTALATFNAAGGITLTTAGADGDQGIVTPHLDSTQTSWKAATLTTDASVKFETFIKTGASIADTIIWAGLKLTNTSVVATDNDQAFFRYEADANSGQWTFVTSRSGTDTTYLVPTATSAAPVAATLYRLTIEIAADRTVTASINGVPVSINPQAALTTAVTLIPYVGVQAAAAAAKAINVHYVEISKLVS